LNTNHVVVTCISCFITMFLAEFKISFVPQVSMCMVTLAGT